MARSPEKLCLRQLAARANPRSGPFGFAWRAGIEQGRLRKPASGESRINSAYAEFEREIIRERVKAGIKAKRVKTGTWGRKALAEEVQLKIKEMIAGKQTIRSVAKTLGVSTRTIRKYK